MVTSVAWWSWSRLAYGLLALGLCLTAAPAPATAARPDPDQMPLIAILDTGIAEDHPALAGTVAERRDFTDSPSGTDDVLNHGTRVAGIALAAASDGPLSASTTTPPRLLNGKVCAAIVGCREAPVTAGIRWAADRGARVINLSLALPGSCSPAYQEAIDYAWARQAVVVAAAGNDATDAPVQPGGCARVLAVAAVDDDDQLDGASNFGRWVGVAAPGVNRRSPTMAGRYDATSGTSLAAPQVSGLAARVWARCGAQTAQAVVDRITGTADAIAGTGTLWQYGRINSARAACPSGVAPDAPPGDLHLGALPAGGRRLPRQRPPWRRWQFSAGARDRGKKRPPGAVDQGIRGQNDAAVSFRPGGVR
jgi:hypothetical protein